MIHLLRKQVMALTDEGYVWVDVPVEVETDASGKIIRERFIEREQSDLSRSIDQKVKP